MSTTCREKLKLTRIVKENHAAAIKDTKFCPYSGSKHLIATVGANQMSVYDNENRGNFMDIMLNYRLPEEPSNTTFTALCWSSEPNDLLIAIGTSKGTIQVVSISWIKCVRILTPPSTMTADRTPIVQMEIVTTAPTSVELCLVRHKSCAVFVWDIVRGICIKKLVDPLVVIGTHPSQNRFVGVSRSDTIREFTIDYEDTDSKDGDGDLNMTDANEDAATSPNCVVTERFVVRLPQSRLHSGVSRVFQIEYVTDEVIVFANVDGVIQFTDVVQGTMMSKLKVSDGNSNDSTGECSCFCLSEKRNRLVYGNSRGDVYISELGENGQPRQDKTTLSHRRCSRKFVSQCLFTESARSVLAVTHDILWRWDPDDVVSQFEPTSSFFENPASFE